MGRWIGSARRNSVKEDLVFSRAMRVWVAETPALLQRVPEKEESVGKRSGDESCGFELEVRAGYLDSGGLIFGGYGCGHIRTYSILENKELEYLSVVNLASL